MEPDNMESDADLLAQFVATFEIFDDLYDWLPRQITTSPSTLEALYEKLEFSGGHASRFPPLYETLLLSYRWAEVDLGTFRLLANEPAEDLSPLLGAMRADKHLFATLMPNGYIPFGKGPDVNYDPVCFDFRHRQKNGDCRIVQLDHEAIACYGRIQEVTEIAPNFRSLVLNTIRLAASKQSLISNNQA